MKTFYLLCCLLTCSALARAAGAQEPPDANQPEPPDQRTDVLVIVGAGGTDEYAEQFRAWSERWRAATDAAQARWHIVGLEKDAQDADADRAAVQARITDLTAEPNSEPLWIVLIGHGTFDGQVARFNLRGRDLTAGDLAIWLGGAERPLVVINCSSASAPFVPALKGDNRIVVAATKSGFEVNYSRFGAFFAEAIADPAADLDKDQQVSVLEAFLAAASRVREFYEGEGRLATEHAILDDNGDGLGIPADWFRGVRATRSARDGAPLDGLRARQTRLVRSADERRLAPEKRARRDQIEAQIEDLRRRKDSLDEEAYYRELERLVVELARLMLGRPESESATPAQDPATPPPDRLAPEPLAPEPR
jgi:hypothetical protein